LIFSRIFTLVSGWWQYPFAVVSFHVFLSGSNDNNKKPVDILQKALGPFFSIYIVPWKREELT